MPMAKTILCCVWLIGITVGDAAVLLNPSSTATCKTATEFFDTSVFECNLCVGGEGEASGVDPLLVCRVPSSAFYNTLMRVFLDLDTRQR